MEDKKRVIWISQYPLSNVSFGVVSHVILSALSKKYNFYALSFGYDGQPLHVNNYVILPFKNSSEIDFYWNEIKPNLVVLFHAVVALPKVMQFGRFSEPSILYVPVEGYRVPPSYLPYFNYFDRVLVTSNWSKEALARDKIDSEVIYHGVDTNFFKPYKRNNEKFTFGYLGSNDIRKQVPTIMDAFARLKGNVQLNLATPIEGYRNLGEVARELNIVPKFQKALGRGLPVSPDKIRDFYYTLDAYIGIGTEGFGLPALEAASTGIPNIAMNYGASKEILEDSALYINPATTHLSDLGRIGVADSKQLAKKMEELKDNPKLAEELGKKGIERAKKFPWDEPIKKLDKIIEEELR